MKLTYRYIVEIYLFSLLSFNVMPYAANLTKSVPHVYATDGDTVTYQDGSTCNVFVQSCPLVEYADGKTEVHELAWEGRGFQYEISEVEECIQEGKIMSSKMSHGMSQELAATMDEVRRQCGIVYPFD